MRAYIIRRIILIIPTLFLATLFVFIAVRFIPGDAIEMMVSQMGSSGYGISEEDRQQMYLNIQKGLGLDAPVHIQYGRWLGVTPYPDRGFDGVFQGSLGYSLWRGTPVTEEIFARLPITVELSIFAIFIDIIIGVPLAIYSAIRQDTPTDYVSRIIAIIFMAIPTFWVGTMITVYPAIWWGWSPSVNYIPFLENPIGNLEQFLLPAVIMGMFTAGSTMRMMRTMMLEVLRQDYIRTAWSKGLTEWTIVIRHAVKNAIIPVVTMWGLMLPMVVGGSVVIEQIFCLPGVGRLLLDSLTNRDYPIVSGINVILACFVVVVNLLVDLTYGWLDPRVTFK